MDNLIFDQDEFKRVTLDLVPQHHRNSVLAVIEGSNFNESYIDSVGLSMTGESRNNGFIVQLSPRIFASGSMWQAIKQELVELFCTNSKKYEAERKDAVVNVRQIVSIISAAVAGSFNIAAGVILGAVTVALFGLLKIGKNAWCKINQK